MTAPRRLLLDTHALFWWLQGNERLSAPAREAIAMAPEVLVSAVTAWELAWKVRIGKFAEAAPIVAALPSLLAQQGFGELDIGLRHALGAAQLAGDHRDPFDRLLAAQALAECLPLVSCDAVFDGFGVRRVW